MYEKWDAELRRHPGDANWSIWKKAAIRHALDRISIPYYGLLDGQIITEATAMLDAAAVQNADGLVDKETAYLSAFRTEPALQGRGYFSRLFRFMTVDLRARGYRRVTLGVNPAEEKNVNIYRHFGFVPLEKRASEVYPDGTAVPVEYYVLPLL